MKGNPIPPKGITGVGREAGGASSSRVNGEAKCGILEVSGVFWESEEGGQRAAAGLCWECGIGTAARARLCSAPTYGEQMRASPSPSGPRGGKVI